MKLAKIYPQALTYTFQLSFEEFQKRNPNIKIRHEVEFILDCIKSPLNDKFIKAINCLSFPEIVIKNCMQNILKKKAIKEAEVLDALKACYDNVFGNVRSNLPAEILQIKDKFAAVKDINKCKFIYFCHQINKLTLTEAGISISVSAAQLKREFHDILLDIQKMKKSTQKTWNIEIFDKWLKDFHWDGGADYLELPGQYNSNMAPNMDQRLKIIKFHSKVTSMDSLRKPIKLDVLCSNGKSYSFLVKCGEDLRQDERIQQLQSMMQHLLQKDKHCSQQKLSLRTYKVIPMNEMCGLLKWIENTASLKSLIDANPLENVEKINAKDFLNFIGPNQGKIHPNLAVVRKPREEVSFKYSLWIFNWATLD